MNRRAFTLIEVSAAVVVLALLAAGVALSVRGDLIAAARAEDAADVVRRFDQIARSDARRRGESMQWTIDPAGGVLAAGPGGLRMQVPARFRIDGFQTPGGDAASIDCSPEGRTVSYAVRLTDTQDENAPLWIAFAGLTGDSIRTPDETQARSILRPAATGRDDAR